MWMLDDWMVFIRAAKALLAGRNPYEVGSGKLRLFGPVWALLIAVPFVGIQDYHVMFWIVEVMFVGTIIFCTLKLFPGNPVALLLIITSVGTVGAITYGNLDPIIWLGLFIPLPIGLLLLAIKPQATLLVMVVLLLRHADRRGVFGAALAMIPLTVAALMSVIIFGTPPDAMSALTWSAGFWPAGLIVGVPLAILAVWRRSRRLAMLAMPFCVPYVSVNSFLGLSYAYPAIGFIVGWWRVMQLGTTG